MDGKRRSMFKVLCSKFIEINLSKTSLILVAFLLFAHCAFASVFYLDPELGSDANNGTTWDLAWKTITSGATAARIAPGDIIKIKKSPDPVSIGNATFTDNNATVTLATAQTKTIDRGEAAWTPSTDVTTNVSTTKQEGTYSVTFAFAANFTTGKAAYKALGSAKDFSAYSKITFWIYANAAIAANTFRIDLCSDTAGDVVVDSFTIPIATRNYKWIPLTIARNGGGSLGNSIQSIRLHGLLDPGTTTVYLDNIEACNDFSLQSLIGKNTIDEPWWGIRSIVETVITLCGNEGDAKYQGTTESALAYRRETFKTTPNTNEGTINEGGTAGNLITFSGGWNRDSGLQDGDTWFSGQSMDTINGLNLIKDYTRVERLFFTRYYFAFDGNSSSWTEFERIGGAALAYSPYYTASPIGRNKFKNVKFAGTHYGFFYAASTGYESWIEIEDMKLCACGISYPSHGLLIENRAALVGKNINVLGSGQYGVRLIGQAEVNTLNTRNNPLGGVFLIEPFVRHFYNTNIEETTKFTLWNTSPIGNPLIYWSVDKYQQTEGDNRRYYRFGEIRRNTSEARGGSGECAEMIPNNATEKLFIPLSPIPASASIQKIVTVYLKKSANYNGSNPRIGLMMHGTLVAGMNDCTVTTSYQQFSIQYTPTETGVLELIVDANGTAGNIYVDDVGYGSITDALDHWQNGVPVLSQSAAGGGGGGAVWGTIR